MYIRYAGNSLGYSTLFAKINDLTKNRPKESDFLTVHFTLLYFRLFKRKSYVSKKCLSFFLVLGSCYDSNRETEDVFDFFVGTLGENGVLFDTDGDIPHLVNRSYLESAEVAGLGDSNVDELINEVLHAGTP